MKCTKFDHRPRIFRKLPSPLCSKTDLQTWSDFTTNYNHLGLYRRNLKPLKLNRVEIGNAEENDVYERKSLHSSLRYILLLAEIFGLLPVMGITNHTPNKLAFSWTSPRFLYTAFMIIFAIFAMTMSWIRLFTNGFSFSESTGSIFLSGTCLTLVLFAKLAKNWPKLMEQWAQTEYQLRNYDSGENLQRRIMFVASVAGILGLVEHLLSLISGLRVSQSCTTTGDAKQAFFEVYFHYMFAFFSYASWKALGLTYINAICTFAWNFLDLFIMVMSIALTDLFARITKKLNSLEYRATPENTWRQIREDYNRVCNLCRSLNEALSEIVFLSFANNLYFICAQLLHSIKPMENLLSGIYFFFSISLLMLRTLTLTIFASRINEESREPLRILFSVPGYAYCAELGRFIQQIGADMMALTGMNFFAIRRGIILTVAGTIVTYELVLIQFHADQEPVKLKNMTGPQPCLQL